MIDQIFTPNHLANELVQYYSRSTHPQLITDFAVGEGSLIKAAYKHWPESQYIVNDIDQNVLSKINLPSSNIEFLNYDFLESDFENLFNKIDLILLNPPFSHINRKTYEWGTLNISSGIALFFIYKSIKYLSRNGQILAILPNGCFSTDRDAKGLDLLKQNYNIEIFDHPFSRVFHNASHNISIVRISKNKYIIQNLNKENIIGIPSNQPNNLFKITRGNIQMHKEYKMGKIPLLHTTSLTTGNIKPVKYIESSLSTIKGRMLLVPRVGNFTKQHIINYYSKNNLYLSDCLFSIQCNNYNHAEILRKKILKDWEKFIESYNGSGAKFITKKKLKFYLDNLYN